MQNELNEQMRADWRPIETAPRDGTAILVMRDIWPGTKSGRAEECNDHNTYVAAWWAGEGPAGAWVCYMDSVQDPICPIDPTHWMSLPPPPSEAARRQHGSAAQAVAVVDEGDDGLFVEILYGPNGSSLKSGDKLYTAPPVADAEGVHAELCARCHGEGVIHSEFNEWGDVPCTKCKGAGLVTALSRKAEQPADDQEHRRYVRQELDAMAEQPAEAQDLPPLPEWLTRTDKGTLVPRSLVIEALRGYARAAIAARLRAAGQPSIFLQNLHYFFAQTDGSYRWPDGSVGDLLKQAKKEIEGAAGKGGDGERLDWLDSQGVAYGFEDIHEGNRWMIDGPSPNVRAAIDAAIAAKAKAEAAAGVKKRKYIEVVDLKTEEVVHRVEVTGKLPRQIETTMRGMLRKIDTDKFFIREPA